MKVAAGLTRVSAPPSKPPGFMRARTAAAENNCLKSCILSQIHERRGTNDDGETRQGLETEQEKGADERLDILQ
jgi:hypothetical protein